MTLITYVTRVHFADGVLEEALWSELQVNNKSRPLILTDERHVANPNWERVLAGLPVRATSEILTDIPDIPQESAARVVADHYRKTDRDLLIAFGGSNAIDLAKAARIAIAHDEPLATFSYARGGSRMIGPSLPDLFAIPSIYAFGAAVTAHAPVVLEGGERTRLMCRKLVPTVTIYDPTLTVGASPEASASAGADSIARCIEAYLSPGYNPPADGIALDGLSRAIGHLETVVEREDLESRREMMAASLNGALALQKGLGVTHAICNALETVLERTLDPGIVSRLVLPGVLTFNQNAAKQKFQPLRHILKVPARLTLAEGVNRLFGKLPLPKSLGDLGITAAVTHAAALLAENDLAALKSPRTLNARDLEQIMQSAL